MRLVPIYLNPPLKASGGIHEQGKYAREVVRYLGLVADLRLGDPPASPRHGFQRGSGGVQIGIVKVPPGSGTVDGDGGRVLAVPTPGGMIRLSAADVAEQASVGGCGLKWATGKPEAWTRVRATRNRGEDN